MIKNILLAITSGLLLALAWPTSGNPILLFVGFVPLLLAIDNINQTYKKSFWKVAIVSYISFIIWNVSSTWWIWFSTPIGSIIANVLNSIFMTTVMLLYSYFSKRNKPFISYIILIGLWICFEKGHMTWEISWPWLSLGNGFSQYHQWIQWYEYTGILGGTLWVLIVNILFFSAIKQFYIDKDKKALIKRFIFSTCIVVIGIFGSLYIYNSYTEIEDKVRVVALQPNVDPYTEKFKETNKTSLGRIIEMTKEVLDSSYTIIAGPETSLPRAIQMSDFGKSRYLYDVKNMLKGYDDSNFLTGITFVNFKDSIKPPNKWSNRYRDYKNKWYDIYNSSFFVSKNTDNYQYYHKSKLVVGVEIFPYRNFLGPLLGGTLINLGGSSMTHGIQEERGVFTTSRGHKIAPIICYESIYGEFVNGYINKGANMFVIITNDGWWSDSKGHKQHLSLAKLRAIENRRSILRSANTGISTIINQKGDIGETIEYGNKGILVSEANMNSEVTYYSKHGDYIYRIFAFLLVLFSISTFTKKKQNL